MTTPMGAPGDGISRREFLAATGSAGAAAMAGCTAVSEPAVTELDGGASTAARQSELPRTDPPEERAGGFIAWLKRLLRLD